MRSAESRRPTPAAEPALFGPIRFGSRWIIAARAPLPAAGDVPQPGWSVAYRDLSDLFIGGEIEHLTRAGYDFALVPLGDPDAAGSPFLSSRERALTDPVRIPVHAPPGVAQRIPDGGWGLAIAPRAGWYPLGALASEAILWLVVAWLLALFGYDLARRTIRWRAVLDLSRRRLQSVTLQLATEVENHKSLQQSFDFARYHDAFTGLPNRRYLMDQLDHGLRLARTRPQYGIAVMLVDINRFTLINELLGQTAGDELMVQVARRFAKTPAASERVFARWGGEQFAVLLFDLHSMNTALTTAKLLKEALRAPFELRKYRVSVAAAIGATWVSTGLQRAEDVLREAAIALSAAKEQGGAQTVVYESHMRGETESLVHLEADLLLALERREFRLLYQPIVELRGDRAVGAEALLRWQHPIEGLLTPDRFLAVAEEAGITAQLTRWVIRNACRLASEWRRRLPADQEFFIDVNLSTSALRDPGLADYLTTVLAETSVPPAYLRFDISEDSLVGDLGTSREMLARLHAMGIRLILDDFGTGYASLSYLQFFPFDYLKIDRTFIRRLDTDARQNKVLGAVVQMASNLGLRAIAEGVETAAALQYLRQVGCEFAQGYWFAEPVSAEDALRHMQGRVSKSHRETELPESPTVDKTMPLAAVPSLSGRDDAARACAVPIGGDDAAREDTVPIANLAKVYARAACARQAMRQRSRRRNRRGRRAVALGSIHAQTSLGGRNAIRKTRTS